MMSEGEASRLFKLDQNLDYTSGMTFLVTEEEAGNLEL